MKPDWLEYVVTPEREFSYTGVFSLKDFLDIYWNYMKERGYDKIERVNETRVFPEGRIFEYKGFPKRKLTDSEEFVIETFFTAKNLQDVDVLIDGKKKKLVKGTISMSFRGLLNSDITSEWSDEKKPHFGGIVHLMRVLGEKFVFQYHFHQVKKLGSKDVDELMQFVLEYFHANSYKRE